MNIYFRYDREMRNFKLLLYLGFIVLFTNSFADDVLIPLNIDARLPADDLVYKGAVLSALEAKKLAGVDLAHLSPKNNQVYDGENHLDFRNAIDLSNEEKVSFRGAIRSQTGLLRFNALKDDQSYTIHLSKVAHSLLLRRNFLSRLGYKLPEMKWLSRLVVQFENADDKKIFLNKLIPEGTLGSRERWVVEEHETDVVLKDVLVTAPKMSDFYNLAFDVPTEAMNARVIRALPLFYALLNLEESINIFSWVTGKIDNRLLVLPTFSKNNFTSAISDIVWGLHRLNKLSKKDIELIVRESHFPVEVERLLSEKLASRINGFNKLLRIKESEELNVDQNISYGEIGEESLLNGKVIKTDFEEYASRFVYGDVETPFDQLIYYMYSKVESSTIDSIVGSLNQYLTRYDANKVRSQFFKDEFQKGLQHFVQTGELIPIGIGSWNTPILNARPIVSRDVVIGSNQGNDNLVQLADTFGFSVTAGYLWGYEGLLNGLGATFSPTATFLRTYTHLKPVRSLKVSIKEPYRNIMVNLIQKKLKNKFISLADLANNTNADDIKNKEINSLLEEINQNLNTGESLILSDSLPVNASLGLNTVMGVVMAGVSVSANYTLVKRIHIYKKSAQELQIFNDKGNSRGGSADAHLNLPFYSLFKLGGSRSRGDYSMKSYIVNLNANIKENPQLYTNALGIAEVLNNKNFEVLESNVQPVVVDANFKDTSHIFSLLMLKHKGVSGRTVFQVSAKNNIHGRYFLFQDDVVSGFNIESIIKEATNAYLQRDLGYKLNLTDNPNVNPGNTILGSANSNSVRFEAEIEDDGTFSKKFLSISDFKNGWSFSKHSLMKYLDKINDKFHEYLFDKNQINFDSLSLYRVGLHLNLYDKGIEMLGHFSLENLSKIEDRYVARAHCQIDDQDLHSPLCGELPQIKYLLLKCQRTSNLENKSVCLSELFQEMYNQFDFDDLKKVIGGEDNFYLYGSIDGFRQGSEVLNDTLYSNSLGKISGKFWNGPLEIVRRATGFTDGEFAAGWMRENL